MSTVYGNTVKLYPSLASAPQHDDESHIYRLKKIEEIEAFLQNEILERERLYKKFKRYSTSVRIVDHTLITATVITGGGGLAALCTGVGIYKEYIKNRSYILKILYTFFKNKKPVYKKPRCRVFKN